MPEIETAPELRHQTPPPRSQNIGYPEDRPGSPTLRKLQSGLQAFRKRVLGEDTVSRTSTHIPPVPVLISSLLPPAHSALAPSATVAGKDDDDTSVYGSECGVVTASTATRSAPTNASPSELSSPACYAAFAALNPYDFDVDDLADRLAELDVELIATEDEDEDEDRQATPTPARQHEKQQQQRQRNRGADSAPAQTAVAAEERPTFRRQVDSFRAGIQSPSGDGIVGFCKKVAWAEVLFTALESTTRTVPV
ncbi:hypothetical protein GGR51DRAFT_509001 [Nemania sp. FL0031]|nr:hypothetical protein GGR51DRAFT_509001 [Nemania sp. FL0031]